MKIKIKRLWNGIASIRDYQYEKALHEKKPLILECGGKKMTVDLEKGFNVLGTKKFKSKFTGEEYGLVDFKFIEDEK